MNARIGWTLLILGFAVAAWLDPWSLGLRDPEVLAGSLRMAVRHAQVVVMRMAFLQIALAALFDHTNFHPRTRRFAAWLTGSGVLLYATGNSLFLIWPAFGWLTPVGALMNLIGFAALAIASYRQQHGNWQLTAILLVVSCGMLLDIVLGLMTILPAELRPDELAASDGVRMRLLRLAQVAVIALSVLSLAYFLVSPSPQSRGVRYGQWAMTAGVVGMTTVLTAAGFTWVTLKYLLSPPAWAVLGGTAMGAWLAAGQRRKMELFGWVLVGSSLMLGMLMGCYAFDGPFPPPEFVGVYNNFARRLLRLGHAYAIVLGLLAMFVVDRAGRCYDEDRTQRLGVSLLVVGTIVTLSMIILLAAGIVPVLALAAGPAIVTAGLLLCVGTFALTGRL